MDGNWLGANLTVLKYLGVEGWAMLSSSFFITYLRPFFHVDIYEVELSGPEGRMR